MNDDSVEVENLLRAMVRYTFWNHPTWSASDLWKHIDGAITIMQKTAPLDETARHNIVLDEYWQCLAKRIQ